MITPMQDILDRTEIANCTSPEARRQLGEESLWLTYECWGDAEAALARHEITSMPIVEILLQGMDIDHEEVTNGTDFYFHDWEIKPNTDDQGRWWFRNNFNQTEFYDEDLLAGLEVCKASDLTLKGLTERFARDLDKYQKVQMKQVIQAAILEGLQTGTKFRELIDAEQDILKRFKNWS